MNRVIVMLSAVALLWGCGKGEPTHESKKQAKPGAMATTMARPMAPRVVFRPPGTPTSRSTCAGPHHKAWAYCQAAIVMTFADRPSFKLQFPGCRPEAVKLPADGVHTVSGTFTTFNTNTRWAFQCTLKKTAQGYEVVSRKAQEVKRPTPGGPPPSKPIMARPKEDPKAKQ